MEKDNKLYQKVYVTAPPKDGEANACLISFLSKEWGIPKSDI